MPNERYGFLDQHPEAILGPFAAAFGFLAYLNLATLAGISGSSISPAALPCRRTR